MAKIKAPGGVQSDPGAVSVAGIEGAGAISGALSNVALTGMKLANAAGAQKLESARAALKESLTQAEEQRTSSQFQKGLGIISDHVAKARVHLTDPDFEVQKTEQLLNSTEFHMSKALNAESFPDLSPTEMISLLDEGRKQLKETNPTFLTKLDDGNYTVTNVETGEVHFNSMVGDSATQALMNRVEIVLPGSSLRIQERFNTGKEDDRAIGEIMLRNTVDLVGEGIFIDSELKHKQLLAADLKNQASAAALNPDETLKPVFDKVRANYASSYEELLPLVQDGTKPGSQAAAELLNTYNEAILNDETLATMKEADRISLKRHADGLGEILKQYDEKGLTDREKLLLDAQYEIRVSAMRQNLPDKVVLQMETSEDMLRLSMAGAQMQIIEGTSFARSTQSSRAWVRASEGERGKRFAVLQDRLPASVLKTEATPDEQKQLTTSVALALAQLNQDMNQHLQSVKQDDATLPDMTLADLSIVAKDVLRNPNVVAGVDLDPKNRQRVNKLTEQLNAYINLNKKTTKAYQNVVTGTGIDLRDLLREY